ncbi:TPA: ATP-binding protein [Klebsiella quasipneumoniae subsp. quasipneumoniae]|uniref:ATP-binding protein n=1 Tax=Enterobacterales TaxID=91347 RepID=UPI000B3FDEF0|nr:ATP-binding protein [Morganella morganii]HBC5127635.1 ATP-binding protein [Citrobacter freundii]HBW1846263.1 ATP-binding protein [Klebsiella quasipneumoniae subsp. quasipneumoniae]OVF56348.1 ATP-binding protein [Morganella morganii]HCM7677801.1 ATP-binding protein [Klebsiella quasipneumoniae subsp. quasipneumoniae]HEI8486095.1 ATP-binding protein [Morganella morganii]
MSLQTNLKGRLRNTSLPKSHGLMPVFEAVVNSIHSIEETKNPLNGKIVLRINRTTQGSLDLDAKSQSPIIGFTIIDNGCGFDEANFKSFETLDSDHKIDKGCRGVGRLMWLKVFGLVEVESHFFDIDGELKKRIFRFDDKSGVHDEKVVEATYQKPGTIIKLLDFDENFRKQVPAKGQSIANQLLEHVLWYFVRQGSAPKILLEDTDEVFDLDLLLQEHMHASAFLETITIRDHQFELTHIKFRASVNKKHQLALCAANRLVKEESIQGKIPGLYGKISDVSGEFTYTCYISSDYLNQHVRSERTSFDIAEDVEDMLNEVSFKDIREAVLIRTKEYLQDVLAENVSAGRKRVDDFINNHAPRYRPIANYVAEELLIVDPEKSDKELELHLHAQWYEVERQLVNEGHDIMLPQNKEHVEEYKERLGDYLRKAGDLKKSDLANYVSHRKVIIDLLQKSIERLEDGKYAREDMIHELIMPMRKDSVEVFLDSCNLWLIDERLAFHNYLASDKTLNSMPITGNESTKEPDLLSLRVFDNPLLVNDQISFPLAAITIIEIKRPMRNDMREGEDKDPIDQALSYLERIREGKVTTKSGRPIPGNNEIPGYCYVLCDITESMHRRCRRANLRITSDGMGYFGYNEPSHAYIEVISFDQLVKAARERNRAFFDKLGLPSA